MRRPALWPASIDDLIHLAAPLLVPALVASVLLDLELEGALVRHVGARVTLG
jgi:DNA processing protein